MLLTGQAAIVTGGASGLGAATVRKLAAQGAKVAVVDLNTKLAESVATENNGVAVSCDVSDAASAEAAIIAAARAHGPARVLVNCAGIGVAKRVIGRDGPMALADFDRVIRVNLIGSFNMLRLATAEMSKLEPLDNGERGVVISTASIAAYDGQIGQSAYSASKGGIVAMTLPIARELAQFGIRVLTIAPGLFLTPLLANLPQEAQDSLAASIPFPRRLGQADEFASLALHMIDNPYLNGEVVRLDAALRMAPREAYCMFVNRRDVQIQWGDCDPANIVYYPRYFEMFDDSTSIMFEAAGFSKQDIVRKYGLVGIPMVDTRAKFYIASTHGDWITIESRVESFKRSSFEVTHKVFRGEGLAVEPFETRVLVGRHPDDPGRLKSVPVPQEIVARFMQA